MEFKINGIVMAQLLKRVLLKFFPLFPLVIIVLRGMLFLLYTANCISTANTNPAVKKKYDITINNDILDCETGISKNINGMSKTKQLM